MAGVRLEGVTHRYGEIVALKDVSIDVQDGEFFAVLGAPPGAGKTTLLRTIAGLEKPETGQVFLGDEDVTTKWPGDRDVAIVFQNLALYPDKSVYNNLAFPLKQHKVPKAEIKRRVDETAKLLRIEKLLDRKPGKLSGGERQRVALGRAMVRDPQAFLFDEPLSALDALLRLEMRTELKRLQRDVGRTLVYVTHDQIEAMSMPDRVAMLREGVVQQIDPPEVVYHKPANRFVATVIGSPPMNFLPAEANRPNGSLEVSTPSVRVRTAHAVDPARLPDQSSCWIGVRPEDVSILEPGAAGTLAGTVLLVEPLGGETVVDLRVGDRLVKCVAPASTAYKTDQPVGVRLDPKRLHIFDENGDAVLSAAGEDVFEVSAA